MAWQLYDLYPKTLEILNNLRKNGTDGLAYRKEGKTAALLIRAKELLDAGHTVLYVGGESTASYHRELYIHIHGEGAKAPVWVRNFSNIAGRKEGSYLLIDEPTYSMQRFHSRDRDYIHANFKVEVVGE